MLTISTYLGLLESHVCRIQALACSLSAQLYCRTVPISHAFRTDRGNGLGDLLESLGRMRAVQVREISKAMSSKEIIDDPRERGCTLGMAKRHPKCVKVAIM